MVGIAGYAEVRETGQDTYEVVHLRRVGGEDGEIVERICGGIWLNDEGFWQVRTELWRQRWYDEKWNWHSEPGPTATFPKSHLRSAKKFAKTWCVPYAPKS